jgi:hypothetical protein
VNVDSPPPAARIETRRRRLVLTCAACIAGLLPPASAGAADGPVGAGLREFLAEKGIDRAGRRPIEEAAAWDDAVQQAAVRVLLRLAAPAELVARWQADATEFGAGPPEVDDRLVVVRGRAVFAAPQPLTAEQRELAAGRDHVDVVRIVAAAGSAVDVLVPSAPRGWPRGRPIDEPTTVCGLPLAAAVGPRPDGWPEGPAALLLAAPRISWTPPTTLGGLGMDYALFDTVADGRALEPGDSAAFFALLAACGRVPDAPPGRPTDIVPLIDPARKWFAAHRGDEVVIAGTVRRATRIAIDEPARRAEVGADHYWELFVFVPTPPLSVDGTLQDSFPVVCCVRELPAGMPTGDGISEAVVVAGFALKRYAYPLADAVIGDEVRRGQRRETPLVLGRRAVWQPRPATRAASDLLFAAFAALAAAVAAALAWGTWTMRRDARRSAARARAELPDTFALPPDRE